MHRIRSSSLQSGTIGVVYCTSSASAQGREFEKLADSEIVDVAGAVLRALEQQGYQAETIDLDPARIADLGRYAWIFNLTETIYGFPLCDYEVARELERLGIRFTGSGSDTLQACLDKAVTKAVLRQHGILTPAYEVFPVQNGHSLQCRFPVIVKPVHEDGSIGISSDSVAHDVDELAARVDRIHSLYKQTALVEEFIEGRDITASVLGSGADARVLPLSEIVYPQPQGPKFLTFSAKWEVDSEEYQDSPVICPCDLEPELERSIQEIALRAFRLMNCRDYARIDFRLQGATPYVLEVNPNPCINPADSGFVRAGKAAGYSYQALIHQILESSVRGHSTSGGQVALRSYNDGSDDAEPEKQ